MDGRSEVQIVDEQAGHSSKKYRSILARSRPGLPLTSRASRCLSASQDNLESKELSAAQFAQLHLGFTSALSKYASNIQGRYAEMIATRISVVFFEAEAYSIIYDNNYEHVEIRARNRDEDLDHVVAWARKLQKLGEANFQTPIWPRASE